MKTKTRVLALLYFHQPNLNVMIKNSFGITFVTV